MERILLKISYIVAILGILMLFVVSQNVQMLDGDVVDGVVSFIGDVESVRVVGNVTFVSLSIVDRVDVVAFDSIDVSVGDRIEVVGDSDEDGVVARRVRVL